MVTRQDSPPAAWPSTATRALVCGHRQHDVLQRQRQERMALHRAALERRHLDIGQRDERPLTANSGNR